MKKLSIKQKNILAFIIRYIGSSGYPPSYREIMKEFEYKSTNSVRGLLKRLQKKGHVKVNFNIARGITLLKEKENV